MQKFVVETMLFLVGLFVSFGIPWLIWRWLRSGRPSTTPLPIVNDGAGGKVIPLIATFAGLRGLSWIGLATNNRNPYLVIRPDGIEYRVLTLRTRSWGEIKQVNVRIFGATVNLGFAFHGDPFTFDANVGSAVLAAKALALLPGHVVLSDRARLLLTKPS